MIFTNMYADTDRVSKAVAVLTQATGSGNTGIVTFEQVCYCYCSSMIDLR